MNWYKQAFHFFGKQSANIIPFNVDTIDDVDYDQYEYADQAEQVFRDTKIRPDNTKNLSHLAVEDGRVVGAISSGWSNDKNTGHGEGDVWIYSFDIAVLSKFRKGLTGLKLISEAIKTYQSDRLEYEDMGGQTMMRLWVVNPNLIPILERYGFQIEAEHGNGSAHMVMY